jgi:hypothetical protein
MVTSAKLMIGIEERRHQKGNVAFLAKQIIMGRLIQNLMPAAFHSRCVLVLCILAVLSTDKASSATASPPAGPDAIGGTALDRGFVGLYNLDFNGAQRDFSAYQKQYPDDPVGPVSAAAGYLFAEFHRLGILESQFYENDESFNSRTKLSPDPVLHDNFENAIAQSEKLAHDRLSRNGRDQDALFAMTLSSGLQADYAALIEKKNLASLHYTKAASTWAQQLLSVCSNCYDAQVATGFSKYIIGSMSAPVRWLMKMGGLPADKQGGIADLQLTAQRGHYLAPFARILLAIAYVRDKDKARALEMLASLKAQFPGNTLFPREIARLQSAH